MPKFLVLLISLLIIFSVNCGEDVAKGDSILPSNNSNYNNDNNNDDEDLCGNGKWDFGEECDGTKVPDCAAWHDDYVTEWEGGIVCSSDCRVLDLCSDPADDDDDNDCDNDGYWEPSRGEACDGDDVPFCLELPEFQNVPSGYRLAGYVTCSECRVIPHCYYVEDTGDDEDECNDNGYWEPELGEECDGSDSPYYDCSELPGFGNNWVGSVNCDNCHLVSECVWVGDDDPQCGDGHVDSAYGEECDGTNLDGVTCQGFGYSGGTLLCDQWCQYNTYYCY